ncbi:MAG: TatD family hydrolase [Clostridia bacterium]|nr:TatD family hydrolase [Clostridia bacterium]
MESLIFDTHAHYDDEAFNEDRDDLLNSLLKKNVGRIINAGVDIESSKASQELAQKYDFMYFAAGFHPENLSDVPKDYKDKIAQFLKHPKCVAVGEIGLDYHYEDNAPREIQKEIFESQVALSKELDCPIIVHDRDSHADVMEILKKYKPKGVLHCFSGSVEMAAEVLKLGMYIGIGGAVTFKNAKKILNVTKSLPLESILLETDAPYMSPVPYRGKRCDSSMILYTAQKIAELKNTDVNSVLKKTYENSNMCFKING